MTKYKWLPTECADENYPMRIIKGDLIFSDGSSIYIPDGKVVKNGWGELGSTHIVGQELKYIPQKLDINWFSYTEDKFYQGQFDLPFEKMSQLFEEGFISPTSGKAITYDWIVVGLAPEGVISLWLGGNGIILEVDQYQAEESQTAWKELTDNEEIPRSKYVELILENSVSEDQMKILRSNGIPGGLWQEYRKQYNWSPEITGSTPLNMWLKTFNGENEYFDFIENQNTRANRAIPKKVKVNWQSAAKKKYTATILFNEEEIFKAFKKFSELNPEEELKLQIKIFDMTHSVDVFLHDSKHILELEEITVDIFSL